MCVCASNQVVPSGSAARAASYRGRTTSSCGACRASIAPARYFAVDLGGGERRGAVGIEDAAELAAELGEPEPDPALGRADRHARAARDLVGREAPEVREHERLALRDRQAPERRA